MTKNFITKIRNIIFHIRLKRAIRKANQWHSLTGHKYLVLLCNGKLTVKSKCNLKTMIKKKQFKCKIQDLEKKALHIT